MGVIVFNGISSKDVGIEVETFPTYDIPEREYESIHVPGRNGDVIIDNATYKNGTRSYEVSIATYNLSYHQKMAAVAKWLHSASGYSRLEDSYEPDFYRQAYYKDSLEIENLFNEAGKATIKFICKPQKFYKSGEIPATFMTSGSIQNRTIYTSLPKILVTTDNTAGQIVISGVRVGIKANAGTIIIIDSELQDAYNDSGTNKNLFVELLDGEFPVLVPGNNTISFSGGVSKIDIIPRWWTV